MKIELSNMIKPSDLEKIKDALDQIDLDNEKSLIADYGEAVLYFARERRFICVIEDITEMYNAWVRTNLPDDVEVSSPEAEQKVNIMSGSFHSIIKFFALLGDIYGLANEVRTDRIVKMITGQPDPLSAN